MHNKIKAYGFELFIGEKGTGKTLCMTVNSHYDLKLTQAKMHIYSNYDLKEPFFIGLAITKNEYFHKIKKEDLEFMYTHKVEYRNSLFLIDEIHAWFDSRNFNKDYNKNFGYFAGQGRKRGNVIRGTTHHAGLNEYRLRLYTGKSIYCYKLLLNPVTNKYELILNNEEELTPEENSRLYIREEHYVKKMFKQTSLMPDFYDYKIDEILVKAQDYFDMYDTEEYI